MGGYTGEVDDEVGLEEDEESGSPEDIARREIAGVMARGKGTVLGREVEAIYLRRYDPKRDAVKGPRPMYVQETHFIGDGKSFSYSGLEAIQTLAQDVWNTHATRRLLLVCSSNTVEESLWYAARSIVGHHNGMMDNIDPVVDNNPFNPLVNRARGRIDLSMLLDCTE